MSDHDDNLFGRAADGDQAAITDLLQQHGPQVRQRLAGKIGSEWQGVLGVDDVMQVTYLEAFLHIARFSGAHSGAFVAWLARIAENNLRDAIRELKRNKRPPPHRRVGRVRFDDSFKSLYRLLSGSQPSPSQLTKLDELKTTLSEAITRLPDDYRTVVRRCDLNDVPVSEVAKQMGRSVGAVHMLRLRAHDHLRSDLGASSGFF